MGDEELIDLLTFRPSDWKDTPEGAEFDSEISAIYLPRCYGQCSLQNSAALATLATAYGKRIAESILPDVVHCRIGSTAHYGAEGANGRMLSDDAMDAALSRLVGGPVNDGVDQPEGGRYLAFHLWFRWVDLCDLYCAELSKKMRDA